MKCNHQGDLCKAGPCAPYVPHLPRWIGAEQAGDSRVP
jgi:hypothetical protein